MEPLFDRRRAPFCPATSDRQPGRVTPLRPRQTSGFDVCQSVRVTYGLAFASPAFAGVVTDRRLTGARRTEDAGKCGLVVYTDGRLAYTLTGLAEQGAFKTRTWLAEKLCEAGRGGRSIDASLREFAAIATADIGKRRFCGRKMLD